MRRHLAGAFAAEATRIRQSTEVGSLRSMHLSMALALLTALGCRSAAWSGPIGETTGAALAGADPKCQASALQGQSGEQRFADPPFTDCMASLGDTTVYLVHGGDQRVVMLAQHWTPSEGQDVAYAAEFQRLSQRFGPDSLCPPNDDLTFTEDRRWGLGDRSISLVRIGPDQVGIAHRLGPIDCHVG